MFSTAKIIAARSGAMLARFPAKDIFILVSVDEHCQHVQQVAEQLATCPKTSHACIAAAAWHDFGKRGNLNNRIKYINPQTAADFIDAYAMWLAEEAGLPSTNAAWCRRFAHALSRKGTKRERYETVKQMVGNRLDDDHLWEAVGLRTSPFPNHAEGVSFDVKNHLKEQGCDDAWVDYAFELIRLHHSFSVRKIVPTASFLEAKIPEASGRQFVADMHTLITADNIVSALYEKVLRATDGTFRIGDPAEDFFLLHDLDIDGSVEWQAPDGRQSERVAHVKLKWRQVKDQPKSVDLTVTCHLVEVD